MHTTTEITTKQVMCTIHCQGHFADYIEELENCIQTKRLELWNNEGINRIARWKLTRWCCSKRSIETTKMHSTVNLWCSMTQNTGSNVCASDSTGIFGKRHYQGSILSPRTCWVHLEAIVTSWSTPGNGRKFVSVEERSVGGIGGARKDTTFRDARQEDRAVSTVETLLFGISSPKDSMIIT